MSKSGIINMIKPPGMTSRDLVGWLKKTLDCNKAGHTGTLDPLATGVLPICIYKATRIIPFLPESEKEYVGEITLGISTNTLDKEGKIVDRNDKWKDLKLELIKKICEKFSGEIEQIPPMFSAIKKNGKPLYKLARKGKEIKREPRKIKIHSIKLLDINLPYIQFMVKCSRGTYIRSLVRDIGEDLKTGAHLSFLVRTSSGPFNIQNAFSIKDIINKKNQNQMNKVIIPLDRPLNFSEFQIKNTAYKRAINGNYLVKEDFIKNNSYCFEKIKEKDKILIYDSSNKFIAIYKMDLSSSKEFTLKAEKVFAEIFIESRIKTYCFFFAS